MNVVQRGIIARRLVVKDLHIQGYSVKEMSEYVGCSTPTIYKDLFALGLREKGEYSPLRREAIAQGVRKSRAAERGGVAFCCVCGRKALKERFQQKYYCEEHLITADDDPDYTKKQRAAAGDRHASHGRDMK